MRGRVLESGRQTLICDQTTQKTDWARSRLPQGAWKSHSQLTVQMSVPLCRRGNWLEIVPFPAQSWDLKWAFVTSRPRPCLATRCLSLNAGSRMLHAVPGKPHALGGTLVPSPHSRREPVWKGGHRLSTQPSPWAEGARGSLKGTYSAYSPASSGRGGGADRAILGSGGERKKAVYSCPCVSPHPPGKGLGTRPQPSPTLPTWVCLPHARGSCWSCRSPGLSWRDLLSRQVGHREWQ